MPTARNGEPLFFDRNFPPMPCFDFVERASWRRNRDRHTYTGGYPRKCRKDMQQFSDAYQLCLPARSRLWKSSAKKHLPPAARRDHLSRIGSIHSSHLSLSLPSLVGFSCSHSGSAVNGDLQSLPRPGQISCHLSGLRQHHRMDERYLYNLRWREVTLYRLKECTWTSGDGFAMLHARGARVAPREIRCISLCYIKKWQANHNVGGAVSVYCVSALFDWSIRPA